MMPSPLTARAPAVRPMPAPAPASALGGSARLERLKGTTIWWPPTRREESESIPGVLVFAPAAPITFINVEYIHGQLDKALAESKDVRLVVIEANGVSLIDYTGAESFIDKIARLRSNGIDVALARLESNRAMSAAERSGLLDALGADHVFHSVEEAVRSLSADRPKQA